MYIYVYDSEISSMIRQEIEVVDMITQDSGTSNRNIYNPDAIR